MINATGGETTTQVQPLLIKNRLFVPVTLRWESYCITASAELALRYPSASSSRDFDMNVLVCEFGHTLLNHWNNIFLEITMHGKFFYTHIQLTADTLPQVYSLTYDET